MSKLMCYGEDQIRKPYHYKECGLDDIYLLNGYEEHTTPYGNGVSVHDVDGLHRAIGVQLAKHKKVLTGKEIRFLRKQMDLTQAELGKWLGVSDQMVARYEKNDTPMPEPVNKLFRALFLESAGTEIKLHELLRELEEFDAPVNERQEFAEENGVWTSKLAA